MVTTYGWELDDYQIRFSIGWLPLHSLKWQWLPTGWLPNKSLLMDDYAMCFRLQSLPNMVQNGMITQYGWEWDDYQIRFSMGW